MSRRRPTDYQSYSKYEEPVKEENIKEEKPVTKSELISGEVVNCTMVNVRQSASMTAPIVTTLSKGDRVAVDLTKSTEDFYFVKTDFYVDGFVKREYLKVEKL